MALKTKTMKGMQYVSRSNAPADKKRIEEAACPLDIDYVYGVEQLKAQAYDRRALARVSNPLSDIYAGIDPRRRQEMADSGMIRTDRNAMANCPTQAIHHEWPLVGYYQNPYIDDTVVE
jgi:ferredoxin